MLDKAIKLDKKKVSVKKLLSKNPLAAVIAVVAVLAVVLIISALLSPKETEIKASGVITEKKNYKIENLFCEALSEKAIKNGWRYYYVETSDNGAPSKDWISPDKKVPFELSLDVTNLSKQAVNFADRMQCRLLYNGQEIKSSVMQENPNQKTANGEKCRSTVSVAVNTNETAKIWFMADIPAEILSSDLPFEAVITVDETAYKVNLRENMKVFSE